MHPSACGLMIHFRQDVFQPWLPVDLTKTRGSIWNFIAYSTHPHPGPAAVCAGGVAPPGDVLALKSSLAVEDHETSFLRSPDGTFSCGFHSIYSGAFTFSIWYSDTPDQTVVWSANRGRPVHSRRSAITLRKDGNMVLTDHDGTAVWQTEGDLPNVQYAQLLDTGNLILKNTSDTIVWQSFDSPTDTFLPTQRITATAKIVSTSRLHVPGHYTFRFSDQSMLSLFYDDTNVSDIYWPDPDYQYYENNRNLYNSTRMGSLDDYGEFFASDFAWHRPLVASNRGYGIKRRLTLDSDVSGTRILDFVVDLEEDVHAVLKKFVKMLSYRLEGDELLWLTEFVDIRLDGDFNYMQTKELIRIAVLCLEEDRKNRPTMESIVESLLSVEEASV
ncbi:hypothetical protein ZWY2020_052325 [Hordeum vulgare]|nr:hypothetical protein ZWY2020_052325 [Hordeum vulgare]